MAGRAKAKINMMPLRGLLFSVCLNAKLGFTEQQPEFFKPAHASSATGESP
jgi:hypothetical protein